MSLSGFAPEYVGKGRHMILIKAHNAVTVFGDNRKFGDSTRV